MLFSHWSINHFLDLIQDEPTGTKNRKQEKDASDEQEPVGVVASIQDTLKANENEKQEKVDCN